MLFQSAKIIPREAKVQKFNTYFQKKLNYSSNKLL